MSDCDSSVCGNTVISSSIGSSSKSSSIVTNLWNNLIRKNQWDEPGLYDEELDYDESPSCKDAVEYYCASASTGTRRFFETARRHKIIPTVAFLTFAVLCAIGLTIVYAFAGSYEAENYNMATTVAKDTGNWFHEEFSKTLLPLFSLSQVVKQNKRLFGLAEQLGRRGDPGSAPGLEGQEDKKRDISGICDDPSALDEFNEIAKTIKKDSQMDDVLLGLRLVPMGVTCMIYPLINREDFEPPLYYNGTSRLGEDWAIDKPSHMSVLRETIDHGMDEVTVSGPFKMKMTDGEILTKTLFCTHLQIPDDDHRITVEEETYNSWGFVMGFVDWEELKDRSNVYEKFDELGMIFKLERTATYLNSTTLEYYEKTHRIAESHDGCADLLNSENSVSIPVKSTSDRWVMTVGYECGFKPQWLKHAEAVAIVVAFIGGFMMMMILTEKYQHKELLYKMMPRKAIRKLNRGQTVVEKYNVVTIFFSDIVGFTSMAGEMRPIEVMRMLNELYVEFDKLVEKHKVYKVETIGDAYMVVGGAPDRYSGPEGAEKVALFALDAIDLVKHFRTKDGARIVIRAGLASGPVVAGVVGNAMPRYCFFGDTVNFASRMESTSTKMKIQCAELTYRLLLDAPRMSFNCEDRYSDCGKKGVEVKGKGWMNSWWIVGAKERNVMASTKKNCFPFFSSNPDRHGREYVKKVDFGTCDTLTSSDPVELELSSPASFNEIRPLKKSWDAIISDTFANANSSTIASALSHQKWTCIGQGRDPLTAATHETEIMILRLVALLEFRLNQVLTARNDFIETNISNEARDQLHLYVSRIEAMYHDVHYHCFEHASHVTLSMNKLVELLIKNFGENNESEAHRHFKGDSLVHFTLVFSALVHDVDHRGESNQMLINQNDELATRYNNSILERNSVDLALELLFETEFENLRDAIFPDQSSKITFAQVMYSTILCTDISSRDRMKICKARWQHLFGIPSVDSNVDGSDDPEVKHLYENIDEIKHTLKLDNTDTDQCASPLIDTSDCLKSPVVTEHMIQVADVAHLMQGWENFIIWNYRLLKELYACHKKGLMPDPTPGWANGQVSFFDGYILPLARRTAETGMFGDDGFKLVRRAEENRSRWQESGEDVSVIMSNGIARGEDEARTIQYVLLRAYNGEKSLLIDETGDDI